MNSFHEENLAALVTLLNDRDVDGCLIYPGPNLLYVSGFFGEPGDRHTILYVSAQEEVSFLTPEKYIEQIKQGSWISEFTPVSAGTGQALATGVVENIASKGQTLALDPHLPYEIARPILSRLSKVSIESAADLFEQLRLRKDPREIKLLENSGVLADQVSTEIRKMGKEAIGMTERELANEIRGRLLGGGGTRVSFPIVVCSGPNGAIPSLRHGDRTIQKNEPVILDFGAYLSGYASDQTRTVVFDGTPPAGFLDAWEAVNEALDVGVSTVEPGIPIGAVDEAVESVLVEAGFKENLRHATGHGIGLEAHEAPAVHVDNSMTIEEGMAFSIEPGVYFPEKFGVRVEDIVVVDGGEAKRINYSPRTWQAL